MLIQRISLYLALIYEVLNQRPIVHMCPIPSFNHNHVLPPHTGNPILLGGVSPYEATILEFCQRFSTSPERVQLLKGLISFRLKMIDFGITDGFQWVDGSFTENIELSDGRAPRDIDVITFYWGLSIPAQNYIFDNFVEFFDPNLSKSGYKLDHYSVDCESDPSNSKDTLRIVELTKYWVQLFCHNRKGVWKGMIKLPLLTDKSSDETALSFLNSL